MELQENASRLLPEMPINVEKVVMHVNPRLERLEAMVYTQIPATSPIEIDAKPPTPGKSRSEK